MRKKLPAFQFYPADWQKDPAVRSCSLAARGLWFDMLCIAHQCTPYGHVCINGKPMSEAQLARLVGESERVTRALLTELEAAGVFSRDGDGVIFSRRMVRDDRVRSARAAGGVLGGNPALIGGGNGKVAPKVNLHSNLDPTPSSSFSSSPSVIPLTPSNHNRGNGHDLLGEQAGERRRRKKPAKRPVTEAPDSLDLTDEMYAWARERGFEEGDVVASTEHFLNHAKANGRMQADWQAAWRTWMLKAVEYRAQRAGGRA